MSGEWDQPCEVPCEEVNFRISEFIPRSREVDAESIEDRWIQFADSVMVGEESEIITKEGVSAELAERHFSVVKNCYVIHTYWKKTVIAWLASKWLVGWTH